MNNTGLLSGKKAICAYLDTTDYMFGVFVGLGMPALYYNSRWYAHKDNLEIFFKAMTKKQERRDYEEIE